MVEGPSCRGQDHSTRSVEQGRREHSCFIGLWEQSWLSRDLGSGEGRRRATEPQVQLDRCTLLNPNNGRGAQKQAEK